MLHLERKNNLSPQLDDPSLDLWGERERAKLAIVILSHYLLRLRLRPDGQKVGRSLEAIAQLVFARSLLT